MKLNISIHNLSLGDKRISLTQLKQKNECYIIVYKNENTYYKPSNENPFQVNITSINWETAFDPIIEVKINGYLFNDTDKEDFIYINAVYGTR